MHHCETVAKIRNEMFLTDAILNLYILLASQKY